MISEEPRLITTIDNPYNPHTQWDEWYTWDVEHGYDTISKVGRVSFATTEIDDDDGELAQQHLVRTDPTEMYLLVTERNFDALVTSQLSK